MATEIRIHYFISLFSLSFLIITHLNKPTEARKHRLQLKNDIRMYFTLSSFGFYEGGYLKVHLKHFHFSPHSTNKVFGFSLDKTVNVAASPYFENHLDRCALDDVNNDRMPTNVMLFVMDLRNKKLKCHCSRTMQLIYISPLSIDNETRKQSSAPDYIRNSEFFGAKWCRELSLHLPIIVNDTKNDGLIFETGFILRMTDESEEGLYNLYFHNCPNYNESPGVVTTTIDLMIDIIEKNKNNYLSAGEMPLPSIYLFISILFFLFGCLWIFILRKHNSQDVFTVHYLMALLVYAKSFSLLFKGINFYHIQSFGYHIEGWINFYYITHFLKDVLLFIIIILLGSDEAVSDIKKKICVIIVISLQVLANVAEIIIEETGNGVSAWRGVFILVDLLCCGAILFPAICSFRHFKKASQRDRKAAINLKKLQLYKHFFITIVCYIYFTRIVVYLLRISMPFNYEWLNESFKIVVTLIFIVTTGFKFRPGSNTPYLQLSQTNDEEMEKVNRCSRRQTTSRFSEY